MRTILLLLFLPFIAAAQAGNGIVITAAGAPPGGANQCAFVMFYVNSANGDLYDCNQTGPPANSWRLVAGAGGGDVFGGAALTTAGRVVTVSGAATVTEQPNVTVAAGVLTALGFSGPLNGTASNNSGTGACGAGSAVTVLNAALAPTCAAFQAALGFTPVTNARTITTTAPLLIDGLAVADLSANRTLSISQSGAATNGYLSTGDWNTFNNKQAALGFNPVTDARTITTTTPLTIDGGAAADLTANRTIACPTCVTSAAALTANALMVGGGLQASATLASLGTTTTVLHGNAGGLPSFGSIVAADCPTCSIQASNQITAYNSCSDAGISDAYACNLAPAITGYTTGQSVWFKAATANTGAATLALNGQAAVDIKKTTGGITTALVDNDIGAGQWVHLVYDGTNFQMMSASGTTAMTGDLVAVPSDCSNGLTTAASVMGCLASMPLLSSDIVPDANMPNLTGDVTTTEGAVATTLASNYKTSSFGISIDGGGSAITTGVKGEIQIPFGCTVTGWSVLLDQSGSIVVDVWRLAYASAFTANVLTAYPTVANEIAGTGHPTVSTALGADSASVAGWTSTAIAAGDVLRFNVDSATTATRATVIVKCTRTQ